MTSLYFFLPFLWQNDLEINLAFDLHLTHTDYLKITISVLCFSDSNEIYSWGNGNSGQYVLALFSLITLLYFHFVSDWLLRNRNTQVHYTEHTVYHLILHSNFDLMLFNDHKQSFCIFKCFKLMVCSIIVFWIFAIGSWYFWLVGTLDFVFIWSM